MFQLQLAVALLMVELCPVGVTRHVDDHLPEPDLRAAEARSQKHGACSVMVILSVLPPSSDSQSKLPG